MPDLRTDGDVVNDHGITQAEVDVFERLLKADKNVAMLDLCCGQGRHVIEFARRGYTGAQGFDRSHYLISRARSQARLASSRSPSRTSPLAESSSPAWVSRPCSIKV